MNIFEELEKGVLLVEVKDTITFGRRMGDAVAENATIALKGEMGAGKTTLTKGIGSAFGIDPDLITSPTYQIYAIHDGERQLVHIDAYRLNSDSDLEELMLDSFLEEPWVIVLEWPGDALPDFMQDNLLEMELDRKEDGALFLKGKMVENT